ncbi:OmpP1/FadL family transporter [Kineobactrum salinum]|uniref:Transporter n=1 Tax=Kineobactrum salinum TaxID=2708301 RepID=A0A6C0U613_9GAMM|nr:outer membrane protein transport protein [Kineobactrum salinum]QIB67388.1 transporter [Kineobactrum salinum]
MKRLQHDRLVFLPILLCGLFPAVASASGFMVLEQSPSRMGTAYAGTASIGDDPSTAWFNPAAMSQLEQAGLTVAGNLIMVDSRFHDRGSQALAGTALQQPLSGSEDRTDTPVPVPSVYYVQPLDGRWSFGFGLTAPFGLVSEYGDNWLGRYEATDSELRVINVNPSLAYRVNDSLSVGVGINYQWADVTLESQVDAFNACLGAGGSVAGCNAAHQGPANQAADSAAEISGNDRDILIDLSLHWRPGERTRVGAIWREGANYRLRGEADFDPSVSCAQDPFCSAALAAMAGRVSAGAALPDTFTVSASHALDERWELHADIAWTGWGSLRTIEIVNDASQLPVSVLELNYDDTMRYALGASMQQNESWTWRFGVAFDEAPQSAARYTTPRIPDADRIWATVGFNYSLRRNLSVDVGYAHLFVDDSNIDSNSQGHQLTGEFESSVDILGVQGTWHF